MEHDRRLTLFELNNLVRRSLETLMPDDYWVEAELSELRTSPQGHCYMELVQKDAESNTPVARAQAKCWRQTWFAVDKRFRQATGQTLHAGMKVLLRVRVNFHEAFGFSWIVDDIDPYFTLGDMARRRQEILAKLKAEGVIDLNKGLPLPLFAQNIAVVSSATAAGYGDFCRQLADNEYGFSFRTRLFAASMQGEQVEASVIAALNSIYAEAYRYDCVVIIRGGGATSDLSGFDTLALAENVANFPLPVITGIGHDRDESVVDFVAHTRVKTPTAAAAFLIANLKGVADRLTDAERRIARTATARKDLEKERLNRLQDRIPTLFSAIKSRQEARLASLTGHMATASTRRMETERRKTETMTARLYPLPQRRLTAERHRIELLAQRANALDPKWLLKRGFSITTVGGKVVHDAKALKSGDKIETRFGQGKVTSTVD